MVRYQKKTFTLVFYCIFILIFTLISLLFVFLGGEYRQSDWVSSSSVSAPPTVIIDAGHGGEDGGAVGVNGCFEKDINFSMAKKLKTLLSSMGLNCILTRSDDTLLYDRNADFEGRKKSLDMKARLDIANSYENAVFISIHQNSFPIEKYSGAQIYYSPNNSFSNTLAEEIENAIRKSLQQNNNRTSKPSDGRIYLLDELCCPAVLIECGFLSNTDECDLLCTEEYQNHLCAVIASEVARQLLN